MKVLTPTKHARLDRTSTKVIILAILPLFIGGVFTNLFTLSPLWKPFLLIILVGIYIAFLRYYTKKDTNAQKTKEVLENENEALKKSARLISSIYNNSAEALNIFSHSIKEESKINLVFWNFQKMAFLICQSVYEVMCEISENKGKDFGVTYVKLLEDNPGHICTIGFSGSRPNVYNINRNIYDPHAYFDARQFAEDNPEVKVLVDANQIDEAFEYIDPEARKSNNGKYNQYMGIPVLCNHERMIGWIQVVAYKKTIISSKPEYLEEISNIFLNQFTLLSALLSKVEKELLSIPNTNIEERVMYEKRKEKNTHRTY